MLSGTYSACMARSSSGASVQRPSAPRKVPNPAAALSPAPVRTVTRPNLSLGATCDKVRDIESAMKAACHAQGRTNTVATSSRVRKHHRRRQPDGLGVVSREECAAGGSATGAGSISSRTRLTTYRARLPNYSPPSRPWPSITEARAPDALKWRRKCLREVRTVSLMSQLAPCCQPGMPVILGAAQVT